MAVHELVMRLGKIAERVQDQAVNEDSPYRGQPILDETSRGRSLDELRSNVIAMRREMIESARSLPGGAFEEQPLDASGNPVWSAGEVITHCNGVLMEFVNETAGLIGIDSPAWTAEQLATWGERQIDQGAALAAVEIIDLRDWLASIPDDADLEKSVDDPALGKLCGRSWLHFIAVHEANHVEQLEELRAAHS